ncbi:regulatory protein RecX [Chloroflexota bacterium]
MAGQITELKLQKRNRNRVNVYVDGRFALGLPTIVAAGLRLGQHLSDPEIAELEDKGTVEGAYNRALNYLSYRPRSKAEVVRYLEGRGVPDHQAEAVTGRLETAGLLDDRAFAQYWVENREQFRPKGPSALRYELRNKGISDDIIGETVEAVDPLASAYRAAGKKARQLSRLDPPTFRRKLVEYLARRGFSYDVAREVTERHWVELAADQ